MKIKTEDSVYLIPIKNGICSLVSDCTEDLINCLTSYFINKKKSKCVILDDEEDLIKYNDVAFIYIPNNEDLKQVFSLKPKTLINNELTIFIENNQEMFSSIENVREQLIELLTDQGMFKLRKIMQKNIDNEIKFTVDDFDITRILQSISIDAEELTIQQMYMALYNLLLYVNRDKFCLVYIDFELDESTINWLYTIKNKNTLLLIKNELINTRDKEIIDYILIENNSNLIKKIEISKRQINDLVYGFHPYILKNLEYQTEKIRSLMSGFMQNDASFLIKFADYATL